LENEAKFNAEKDVIDSLDYKYYNDPAITFEDSIVTGCHLDLNFEELALFCKQKQF
jgi:hypothetical protein